MVMKKQNQLFDILNDEQLETIVNSLNKGSKHGK